MHRDARAHRMSKVTTLVSVFGEWLRPTALDALACMRVGGLKHRISLTLRIGARPGVSLSPSGNSCSHALATSLDGTH